MNIIPRVTILLDLASTCQTRTTVVIIVLKHFPINHQSIKYVQTRTNKNMNVGNIVTGVDNDLTSYVISEWTTTLSRRYQHYLDKSTLHVFPRWIAFTVVFFIYALRVYFVQGFYIITYALGIYILQLFLAFLSPQVDPEYQQLLDDGPALPTCGNEEFRPFVRRLPEFKFWCVVYNLI